MNISTAPRWSDDDERRELEGLSDIERQRVQNDLFGRISSSMTKLGCGNRSNNNNNTNNNNTNDSNSDGGHSDDGANRRFIGSSEAKPYGDAQKMVELVAQLESAPYSQKEPYEIARDQAPDVVRAEAKLDLFLRREDGHVGSACERVCSYWSTRKDLFQERCNRPLLVERPASCSSQFDAEHGALQPEDLTLLRSGLCQILPNDQHGRPVVFFRRTAFWQDHSKCKSLMRCWFFILSRALKKQQHSDSGIVVICNFKYFESSDFDRRAFKAFFNMLMNTIPVRVSALHFCYVSRRSAFELVLPVIKQLMCPHLRRRLLEHVGDNAAICSELTGQCGIIHLHQSLGGEIPDTCVFSENPAWARQEAPGSAVDVQKSPRKQHLRAALLDRPNFKRHSAIDNGLCEISPKLVGLLQTNGSISRRATSFSASGPSWQIENFK